MRGALDRVLRRLIRVGRFTVRWPDGESSVYEGLPGGEAAVALRDDATVRGLVLTPDLAFGEAYMDGRIEAVGCSLYELLEFLYANLAAGGRHPVKTLHARIRHILRTILHFNPAPRARRNVAHHYDLHGELYRLFLDADLQYSCAYFRTGDETLEDAQAAKKRHIASKLLLTRPGLRVLDIGSGWGGMALTLARDYGARVTGITLSEEQLHAARARAEAEGVADLVNFEAWDYRAISGRYDRIVSVGMFEHVGLPHYGRFFRAVREALVADGVALVHTIGHSHKPATSNVFLAKYIFPGGYSPSLSEILPAVEASGLVATDIEMLRGHYARTLRHWRQRFAANREAIAGLYDERFCRMFEFYLAGCELAFRYNYQMNFQIQLAPHQGNVPPTRDYLRDSG